MTTGSTNRCCWEYLWCEILPGATDAPPGFHLRVWWNAVGIFFNSRQTWHSRLNRLRLIKLHTSVVASHRDIYLSSPPPRRSRLPPTHCAGELQWRRPPTVHQLSIDFTKSTTLLFICISKGGQEMRTWIVYKEQCRGFTISIINIPEKDMKRMIRKQSGKKNKEMTQWDLSALQLNC